MWPIIVKASNATFTDYVVLTRNRYIAKRLIDHRLVRAVLYSSSGSSFRLSAFAFNMTAQIQRPPLQQLLSEAFNAPNCIHTQDGGAVLALSIHCKIGCTSRFCPITASSNCCAGLFVQAGFTTLQTLRPNGYTPQPHWNSSREAWTFQYKKYAAIYVIRFVCIQNLC